MTTRTLKWLRTINAGLLIASTVFLIFFSLKGPLYFDRSPELKEEQVETRTASELGKQLLRANSYIQGQERVARDQHIFALAACVVVCVASALNLARDCNPGAITGQGS
jgi:hypothetical protein